jgi:alkylation response protein AidB-like acyl-CoA dehydrogenase
MEEMSSAGAPGAYDQGVWHAGAALMMHGTAEQQDRWLPLMKTADVHWCQLFSEPGTGSDLASLETRAVSAGDEYIVNGRRSGRAAGRMRTGASFSFAPMRVLGMAGQVEPPSK